MSTQPLVTCDCVEVCGPDSDGDLALKGQFGTLVGVEAEKGFVEISIQGLHKKFEENNLRKVVIKPVECVEIFGLTSEGGKLLNGKIGVVSRFVPESIRYEIHVPKHEPCNLRPCNIRRLKVQSAEIATTPGRNRGGVCQGETPGDAKRKRKSVTKTVQNDIQKMADKDSENVSALVGEHITAKETNDGQGEMPGDAKRKRKSVTKTVQNDIQKVADKDSENVSAPVGEHITAKETNDGQGEASGDGNRQRKSLMKTVQNDTQKVADKDSENVSALAGEHITGNETNDGQGEAKHDGKRKQKSRTNTVQNDVKNAAGFESDNVSAHAEQNVATKEANETPGPREIPPMTPEPRRVDGETECPKELEATVEKRQRTSKQTVAPTTGEAQTPPAKQNKRTSTGRASTGRASTGRITKGEQIDPDLDEAVLEEARRRNLDSALRNLACRDVIMEHGFSSEALLEALNKSDGLVNKAKALLLGGA